VKVEKRDADLAVVVRSYERALAECLKKGSAHMPHMLRNAFKMHTNFEEHGTMKLDKWD